MNDILSPAIRLGLAILVSYRITDLIVLDDGPFDIFKKIREEIGKFAAIHKSARGLGKLINCPFCLGVWISGLSSLLVFFPSIPGDIFLIVIGIAGGQALMDSVGGRWNK